MAEETKKETIKKKSGNSKKQSTNKEKSQTNVKNEAKTTKKVEKNAKITKNASKSSNHAIESQSAKTAKKTQKRAVEKSEAEKPVPSSPKHIKVLGFHDLELNTYVYDKVKNPKAVVLIVHGMQEHILRYAPFAEFLQKNGYVVVMSDLRGHGHTMQTPEEYGKGEKDIFTETLKDQLNLIEFAHDEFKLPLYIFGHSYGSMLTQFLVQLSPIPEKAVICGTTNGDSGIFKLGSLAVGMMSPFEIHDKRGGLAEKLCIKSFGKKFENGNWLSRDDKVFEAYLKDDLCGGSFPFSFYRSMIKNMRKANKGIGKIGNKKLFLIAGDKDPVGENGKQVKKLYKTYLKNNINARMKLYPNARHELLNEINKDEVYADVLSFFDE